jgi:hypothetical protein
MWLHAVWPCCCRAAKKRFDDEEDFKLRAREAVTRLQVSCRRPAANARCLDPAAAAIAVQERTTRCNIA